MRLTVEMVLQDNKRFEMCNALAELKYCGWEVPHRKSITNDEIRFYAWLCRSAVELLKEQQAVIEQMRNDSNARRCKDCRKRNQHKECKEGYGYHSDDWFCADFDPSDEAVLEAFAEDG